MKKASLLISLLSVWAVPAHADPVSADGAQKVEQGIASVFGPLAAKALTVTPDGDRYKLQWDLHALFQGNSTFSVTPVGASAVVHYLKPLGGALWQIDEQDPPLQYHLNMNTGQMHQVADVSAEAIQGGAIYDTDLGFYRQAKASVRNLREHTESPLAAGNLFLSTMDVTASGTPSKDGGVDVMETLSMTGLSDAVVAKRGPSFTMVARSAEAKVSVKALRAKELTQVASFAFNNFDKLQTSPDIRNQLLGTLANAMPIVGELGEDIVAKGVSIRTAQGAVALDELHYGIHFGGVSQDSSFDFTLHGSGVTVPEQIAGLADAGDIIPKEVSLAFGVRNLDIEDVVKAALKPRDAGSSSATNEADAKYLRENFVRDGKLTMVLRDFSAHSSLYDLQAQGSLTQDLKNQNAASGEADITMVNYDKTLSFLQANASKVKGFGQAATALQFARGMAKVNADGALTWSVELTDDNHVYVNGAKLR